MRRRLFNLAAAVSLVLCVATVALWVRSHRFLDHVERVNGRRVYSLATFPGGLVGMRQDGPRDAATAFRYRSAAYNVPRRTGTFTTVNHPAQYSWRRLGFGWEHEQYAPGPMPGTMLPRSANALPGYSVSVIRVPLWFLTLATAIPPALALRRFLRRRMRTARHRWRPPGGFGALTLQAVTAYFVASILTLPFLNALWLGGVPLLALVQLPKTMVAGWLRTNVVMPTIAALGMSRGSFSPDYVMARPYALAMAYFFLLGLAFMLLWVSRRMTRSSRRWTLITLVAATMDFCFTLWFADGRALTVY